MADSAQGSLDQAVRQGIITPEQAQAITMLGAETAGRDEPVELVSNFSDLFLCLGLMILYWSMGAFGGLVGGNTVVVAVAFAGLFWILAEIFTFKAGRKFPAVVCAVLFVWLVTQIYIDVMGSDFRPDLIVAGRGSAGVIGAATTACALALIRFRLPILVLGVAIGAVLIAFTIAMRYVQPLAAFSVLALCGAALLLAGMVFDYKDRDRTGQGHEWALWLFVVGSPLMVHGIMLYMLKDYLPTVMGFTAAGSPLALLADQLGGLVITIAVLALLFTLLGLVLDRRSLVASSLLYFTAVLSYAAFQANLGMGIIGAIIPLGIGLTVIILGLAWNRLRAQVLRIIPVSRWVRPA